MFSFSNISPVVKNLLILNGIFFLSTVLFGDELVGILGAYYWGGDNFRPYQLVTYMFMHGGVLHLFFNMFALVVFGNQLEQIWGAKRFLFFYFFTGLGAVLIQQLVYEYKIMHITDLHAMYRIYNTPTVGASGSVYGVLVAFAMLFPNTQLMLLFPPIPIKAKYLVMIMIAVSIFSGISSSPGDNIAHFAHLGGALFGYLILKYWSYNKKNFF